MHNPMSSEDYLKPLEDLMADLSPDQRRKLADWISHLAHYGRELIGRVSIANGVNAWVLRNPERLAEQEAKKQEIAQKTVETIGNNVENFRQLFNDLQDAVAGDSWLNKDTR